MVNNKKIIGICTTKIQDPPRSRMLSALNDQANSAGFKLMVFNSPFGFGTEKDNPLGAAGIYDYINYSIIDALVVMCSGFLDKTVCHRIIQRALKNHVPVILEDMEYEGCITIRNSFEESLANLLNHCIREHGVRDTFFVAGTKDNDYSKRRLDVYKRVLSENNLPFSEDMVDYGDFWEGPTIEVMKRLFENRKTMPQAIFCANDAMGVTVCKQLQQKGYRVPEDVLVTGFDGSRMGEFSQPRMATCEINQAGFAQLCIEILQDCFSKKETTSVYDNCYHTRYAESCGCNSKATLEYRLMAKEYHRMLINSLGHEYVTYNDIMYLLNTSKIDSNLFYGVLSKILDKNAVLAYKPSWLSYAVLEDREDMVDDELVIMEAAARKGDASQTTFSIHDMIPDFLTWVEERSMYVINAVQISGVTCGFYEYRTDDIKEDSQKINRVLNIINMISYMAFSDLQQRYYKIGKGEEVLVDSVTELANLSGVTKWYQEFMDNPANADKFLSVSIYQIPKYKYIYENYGMKAIETAACIVAEGLRVSNSNNSFLARISNDEFIVINYYDNEETVENQITNSVSVFYNLLEKYNQTNGLQYYLEINAGCTHCQPVNGQKLEFLIQIATNELYYNRVIYGIAPAEKVPVVNSKERYDLFNVLISQNLFRYCFQPIVCANTGEIFGYEALMRTDDNIGFSPLDILSIATEYGRLYEVEKATLYNVMDAYSKMNEGLKKKKLFINCIPGHSLRKEDSQKLGNLYAQYISNFVFEITEQNTMNEKELSSIRSIGNFTGKNQIAIDDYGTGHSNLVNLINYAPEIVKLDRFLMQDIDQDISKQMLVKSTIDFAKMRDIKVLAEGIETVNEMEKVIELGVDYIQGYYTGRPSFEPVLEIQPEIKAQILNAFHKKTIEL